MSERVQLGWPSFYAARFHSSPNLAAQVSRVLAMLTAFGKPSRVVVSIAIFVLAIVLGWGLVAALRYPPGWQFYGSTPLVVLIVGFWIGSIPGDRLRDMYAPRSTTGVLLKDGTFGVTFNHHQFSYPMNDLVRVRKFGDLAAIEFTEYRFVVMPMRWLPHYTDRSSSDPAS